MKTVEEQLQELRNRVETLESRLEVVKEVLMDTKAKSFKFYSEEESKALVEALKDVPVGPDIMKTCEIARTTISTTNRFGILWCCSVFVGIVCLSCTCFVFVDILGWYQMVLKWFQII